MTTDKQYIKCPNCGCISLADVKGDGFLSDFTHNCPACNYTIMEQEWDEVFFYKWISVEDVCPCHNQKVLALDENGKIHILVYLRNGKMRWVDEQGRWTKYRTRAKREYNTSIMYWLPMPKIPQTLKIKNKQQNG